MKLALAALLAVGAFGASLVAPAPAKAAFFGGHAIEAPSLVESVQCVTRTVRSRQGNRVTVRTVRDCGPRRRPGVTVLPGFRVVTPMMRPAIGGGCRDVTTRTRVGNRTVVRTVRRC